MPRPSLRYRCTQCGYTQASRTGRCPECGAWDAMAEDRAAAPVGSGHWAGAPSSTVVLGQHRHADRAAARWPSGIVSLDRPLGGGLVTGSVVLLGGDPGIGKSTLLLQAADAWSRAASVVYVSGEETGAQMASRAERMGLTGALERVVAIADTDVDAILAAAASLQPRIIVVDSIQTLVSAGSSGMAGSVAQVRACAGLLTRYAKQHDCAVVLIGHVTKDGQIAGPRVLEHMVDAVLSFEGDQHSLFRLLRASKNRFGATGEVGAFVMQDQGLMAVDNPSALFLDRDRGAHPGGCVFIHQDGPRPLLLDIQSLLDPTAATTPRRLAVGVAADRVAMLLAILHRHGGLAVGDYDVFVNAVGGLRITDTGVDLAVALAMASSFRNQPLPAGCAAFGEVGLTSEVRPVGWGDSRVAEAVRQGFTTLVVPRRSAPASVPAGVRVLAVATLGDALQAVLP